MVIDFCYEFRWGRCVNLFVCLTVVVSDSFVVGETIALLVFVIRVFVSVLLLEKYLLVQKQQFLLRLNLR